jgi:YD repeat-containing protein
MNKNGKENWKEYDPKGNMIHYRDSDGNEEWYDENGNIIYHKFKSGYAEWYDSNGNIIHSRMDGYDIWYKVDEN